MAYLNPPFKHDLFVSYAHGRGGRLKAWSRCLATELRNDILDLQVEFDDLDIFIDEELDPTLPLTEQLRGTVQSSGLLLVIMSQRYMESAWCKDEIEWFESEIEKCKDGGGMVLVVRAQPTQHDRWPTALKDERGHVVLGFKFHPESRDAEEAVRPFGWPEPQNSDRDYFKELSKLSTIVTRRLRQMKEREALRAEASQQDVKLRIEGEPTVYLQASPSQQVQWQSTKETIEQMGCVVLPETLAATGSDLNALNSARKERLRLLSQEVNALCLLQPADAQEMGREVASIANDRSALQAFDQDLPCAVISRTTDDLSVATELGIDTINAADEQWMANFKDWLQRVLSQAVSE